MPFIAKGAFQRDNYFPSSWFISPSFISIKKKKHEKQINFYSFSQTAQLRHTEKLYIFSKSILRSWHFNSKIDSLLGFYCIYFFFFNLIIHFSSTSFLIFFFFFTYKAFLVTVYLFAFNCQALYMFFSFLIGRAVMLEQPRKSGTKVISHMLASHGGEIFIHTLSISRSILEDPPSISEGSGGRVTDYRIPVSAKDL